MLHQKQIRGIIALAIFLAFIPFFDFVYHRSPHYQAPIFSTAGDRSIAVEFIDDSEHSGIYFLEPSTTFKHFLRIIAPKDDVTGDDFNLENGISIKRMDQNGKSEVFLEKISAEKRMALGLPLDINLATFEELLLVPGLGEATIQKIISHRRKAGRFHKLEQLTEINGIKEKRLQKLSKYLYVEKAGKNQKNKIRMLY